MQFDLDCNIDGAALDVQSNISATLRKLPPLTGEDHVLLIGAGGLGLAALGLCPALTPARTVVADIDAAKLAWAAQHGAHAVIDLREPDAQGRLRRQLGEGVRAVVDFVGSAQTLDCALKVCDRGGVIIVVGLFGGALPLSTALLPMRHLTLRGSYVGTLQEMAELLALLQRQPVWNVPLGVRPMSQINEAMRDLAEGRVAGRLVALAPA